MIQNENIRPRILAIVGPTASGKSALAMQVARKLGGELVNADSVQVYKGLQIGSAKASAADRAEIPHHLLDIADPNERFSAARYRKLAIKAIEDILARDRVPILVGGTGLYLRVLLYGLIDAAPNNPKIRKKIEREFAEHGNEFMHSMLREVDPIAAERIHKNDQIRIVRALEVYRLTGIALSEHHATHEKKRPIYNWAGIALTSPRNWLWKRIEKRCYAMVKAGLVDEVRSLVDSGIPLKAPAFRAIGYAHVIALWNGQLHPDSWIERMSIDTRRYAKRQLTWFRKEKSLRWINAIELAQNEIVTENLIHSTREFFLGGSFRAGVASEKEALSEF